MNFTVLSMEFLITNCLSFFYQTDGNCVTYEGGSICNENPFITPSTSALGFNAICQTIYQSVAVIMVHETLFYLSEFNMLQAI